MPASYVGRVGTSTTTTMAATAVAVGDVLIVQYGERGSSGPTPAVTDSKGNTYSVAATLRYLSNSGGGPFICQVTTDLTSSDTLTLNPGGATGYGWCVDHFTGLAGTVEGANSTGSITASVTSGTTTNVGDLIYGCSVGAQGTFTTLGAPTGWTALPGVQFGSNNVTHFFNFGGFIIPGSTGTFTWAPSGVNSAGAHAVFGAFPAAPISTEQVVMLV